MKRIALVAIGGLLLAGGLLLGWNIPNPWKLPSPNESDLQQLELQQPQLAKVVAQGRLQPAGGFLYVYGPPGSRVTELFVSAGALVEPGAELLRYTGQRILERQAELARARKADLQRELQQKCLLAEANLEAAELGLKNAQLNLSQAQAEQDLAPERERLMMAQTKLTGLRRLAEDPETAKLISPLAVQDQELEIRVAESELARAERKLAAARESLALALEVAANNRNAAQRTLDSAREAAASSHSAQLGEQIADLQVEESRLVAPIAGQVFRVTARKGEAIGTAPLLQLGNTTVMECVAEVNDTLVGQVQLGQRVTLSSEALPRELAGKVVGIGKLVGVPSLRDPNPLALVDRRSVEVKIELNPNDAAIGQAWLNLQVTVEIDLGPK